MMNMVSNYFILVLVLCSLNMFGQVSSGKIVYERKTNLYKKFKDNDVKDWLKEEDRNKIDMFELYFNDSLSVFKPQESELKERMSWATSKNTVYQDFSNNHVLNIKEIWGEKMYVSDTLWKRTWKITNSKRSIAGYVCRKAIWQANDTIRIYAWYADDIIPEVGPETFYGLPGAILGLATEDGGVIYFAKSVESAKIDPEQLKPGKLKAKIQSRAELRAKLEKDFGKEPWGKAMLSNVFGVW